MSELKHTQGPWVLAPHERMPNGVAKQVIAKAKGSVCQT
jgi:hypothetical protein